ncbi:hypothetical protein GW17_00015349 [Ensete ventricosum]|nr:hypothetical protein GW17_00015349 [Ensete ventricosum]RZR89452.1 hypothetical protein BHM03_00017180 [Ensete ventricosum]
MMLTCMRWADAAYLERDPQEIQSPLLYLGGLIPPKKTTPKGFPIFFQILTSTWLYPLPYIMIDLLAYKF